MCIGRKDSSMVHGTLSLVLLTVLFVIFCLPVFRAAGEFCKLSGLLCSYGLYQVCVLGRSKEMGVGGVKGARRGKGLIVRESSGLGRVG